VKIVGTSATLPVGNSDAHYEINPLYHKTIIRAAV
jgi:hypothetical protein